MIDFVKRVKLKQGDCAPSNASEEGKEEASQSSEDKRPQGIYLVLRKLLHILK